MPDAAEPAAQETTATQDAQPAGKAEAAAKPAALPVDWEAQAKTLEKRATSMQRDLDSLRAKVAESDGLRTSLAAALGVERKEDPAAAAQAMSAKVQALEAHVRKSVLSDAVRKSGVRFAEGVEAEDVLAFDGLGGVEIDPLAGALKDPDAFRTRLQDVVTRKPFLVQPVASAPAARGVPAAPAAAPPVVPVTPAQPARKIIPNSSASIFYGRN